MQFALRYFDPQRGMIVNAWQSSLSVVRDMADFYESQGCTIVSLKWRRIS